MMGELNAMAYFAGVLDSCGHLAFEGRAQYRYPTISVTSVNRAIPEQLARRFGGKVTSSKRNCAWRVRGSKAREALVPLLPYLKVRLVIAAEFMAWQPIYRNVGAARRGRAVTPMGMA